MENDTTTTIIDMNEMVELAKPTRFDEVKKFYKKQQKIFIMINLKHYQIKQNTRILGTELAMEFLKIGSVIY